MTYPHQPIIRPIGSIILPPPDIFQTENGVNIFGYNGGQKDVIKLDILFDAGRWTEPAPLIADAVARLIKSGTSRLNASELSGKIDFYGASIQAEAGYNTFTITLICLNRYLKESLHLVKTCLTEIVFPEKEISLHREKSLMRLKVNEERNEYVADMSLKSALFGNNHPYGYETREDDIAAINQREMEAYFANNLTAQNVSLFVSGSYSREEIDLISGILNPAEWGKGPLPEYPSFQAETSGQKEIRLNIPGSVQSSIAMGTHLFNRQHPDFTGVAMLNTVFGGYFGSRLMQNIREEKGMTYGIYSEIQTYKHGGLLLVSTETDIKHTTTCLQEIHREAHKLRTTLVGKEELSQARNYMLGKLLSRTDGPFNKSSAYRNLFIEGYDEKKFESVVEEVRNIDNKRIRSLAEQYLHTENMYCVVVS